MRLAYLLLGLTLSCAACAAPSVPMADTTSDAVAKLFSAPDKGAAALYIAHVDSFSGTPAINVSLGSTSIGGLVNDTWFRLDLPPGRYDVRATGRDGSGSLNVDLASGDIKFVTTKYARTTLTGILTEVPASDGRRVILAGRRARAIQ